MKKINVGILGLGVVGGELANIISQNRDNVLQKYDIELSIKSAYVRDLTKQRTVELDKAILTENPDEVVGDPEIDIICECMGGSGTEQTRELVLKALKNGKQLIMSSKKVLAKYSDEVLEAHRESGVQLRYDATVGGGIPVGKIIKDCFKGEKIKKIVGILNATSNFIYTFMEQKNYTFDEALQLAQKLGFAENDPTEDVEGYDALYKLVVLILFSMKKSVNIEKMTTSSFTEISLVDMNYAKELGYRIKPLAVAEDRNGKLTYRVGPCLIKENHVVASAVSNYNIIVFEGSNSGTLGFYGQGAGAKPTASAMYDDLINVLTVSGEYAEIISKEQHYGMEKLGEYSDYSNDLYWRYTVENKVGMLAKICLIFMDNNINIEKLIQKDEVNGKIDVVLLTRSADTITINKITSELAKYGIIIDSIIPFFND